MSQQQPTLPVNLMSTLRLFLPQAILQGEESYMTIVHQRADGADGFSTAFCMQAYSPRAVMLMAASNMEIALPEDIEHMQRMRDVLRSLITSLIEETPIAWLSMSPDDARAQNRTKLFADRGSSFLSENVDAGLRLLDDLPSLEFTRRELILVVDLTGLTHLSLNERLNELRDVLHRLTERLGCTLIQFEPGADIHVYTWRDDYNLNH
ncbi:hypothetical protein F5Y16DRAFT_401919 [Xylariaceae sp. FL0255]|nr:hypothetical protein F5Y16DRAFT_401919 [Xylariaceae sp. FL0255]